MGPVNHVMGTVRPPGTGRRFVSLIGLLLVAGLLLTATPVGANAPAEEPTPVFSGIAQKQTVAPVPRAAWMGAAIMGVVIVVSMRRTWRGRHAR